jgi:hypothetical protein
MILALRLTSRRHCLWSCLGWGGVFVAHLALNFGGSIMDFCRWKVNVHGNLGAGNHHSPHQYHKDELTQTLHMLLPLLLV